MTIITTNAYTKVIKDWTTESGLRAVILLVRDSHHCGYVEVPEHLGKPGYDESPVMELNVHGGVTYAGELPEMDGKYVVGYDCAHYGDLMKCPEELKGTSMEHSFMYSEGIWRDVDYCTNECESLANQLVNIKLLN